MLLVGGGGPRPACMNSGIIVGIVRRAKSCCVSFSGVTSQPVHGRLFISYLTEGAEDEASAGSALRSTNTQTVKS